jgi:outer membrane immunogenic protein
MRKRGNIVAAHRREEAVNPSGIATAGNRNAIVGHWRIVAAWRSHFIALAVALLAVIAGSEAGRAADAQLFVKARPAPVAVAWDGFYIGAHGGYGWANKKFVDNFPFYDGQIDAEPQLRGGLDGFQAGYNYRTDWLVLGIEGEFSWSGLKQNDFSCFTFGDQVCSAKSEWFAAVTARIGVADGSTQYYLKGGPAWTHDRFTDLATCAGTQPITRNGFTASCGDTLFSNQTRFGWLIGGGIEYLFASNWSLKLEYNYMDFGGRSVLFNDGANGIFTEEIHQKINVVKVGLNYYFGGASAAAPLAGGRNYAYPSANGNGGPSRVVTFAGFDVAKSSYGALAGAIIAPSNSIDSSGLRVLILGEAGHYKYPDDPGSIRGTYTSGDLLIGYAFEGDNYSINLMAGGNATNHMLSEIDTENSVQGTAFGGKVRTDAWVNPTPATLVYGEADYSTAFRTYYAKAKLGYDITNGERVFVGPEVAVLGNERFNQWRLGGHITQLKLGKTQVDITGGYAHDSVVGNSAYGGVEFSANF